MFYVIVARTLAQNISSLLETRVPCRASKKSKVICKITTYFSLNPKEVTALKLHEEGFKTKEDSTLPQKFCGSIY